MRIAVIILCCVALYIEAILWIFLNPLVGKTMSALLGLSAGAGFGVASGMNPIGPAIVGFLVVFLLVPGRVFTSARNGRVDWWRRKFADFSGPWQRYANVILDASSRSRV